MIQPELTNNKHRRMKESLLVISLIAAVFLLIILNVFATFKYMRKACDNEIESLISSIDGSEDCVTIHLADGGKKSLAVLHSPDGESCYIKDGVEIGFLNEEHDLLEIYRLEDSRYTKDSEQAEGSLFDTFQIAQDLAKYKDMQVEAGIIDKKDEMKMEVYLEGGTGIGSFYYEDGARVHFSGDNYYTHVSIGDTAKSWLSTVAAFYLGNVEDTAIHDRLFKCFIDFGATREKAEVIGHDKGVRLTEEDKDLLNKSFKHCTQNGPFVTVSSTYDVILINKGDAAVLYLDDNEVEVELLSKNYDRTPDFDDTSNSDSLHKGYLSDAVNIIGNLSNLEYTCIEDNDRYSTDGGFEIGINKDTLEIVMTDNLTHRYYKILGESALEAKQYLGDGLINRYYKALKSSDAEESLIEIYEATFINN